MNTPWVGWCSYSRSDKQMPSLILPKRDGATCSGAIIHCLHAWKKKECYTRGEGATRRQTHAQPPGKYLYKGANWERSWEETRGWKRSQAIKQAKHAWNGSKVGKRSSAMINTLEWMATLTLQVGVPLSHPLTPMQDTMNACSALAVPLGSTSW